MSIHTPPLGTDPRSLREQQHDQGQTSLAVDGKRNYEVALLDPITYMANENGQRYVGTLRYNNRTYYTANRYETQVTYDNAADVLELLNNTIKIKPYNLNLRDKIKDGDSGLTNGSTPVLRKIIWKP